MGVEPVGEQRFGHTQPVEHAADAVDAEAPERAFAVLADEVVEPVQLVRTSSVERQFATFPARPGIWYHSKELRCFGLGQRTQGTSQVDQVQLRASGRARAIRHV